MFQFPVLILPVLPALAVANAVQRQQWVVVGLSLGGAYAAWYYNPFSFGTLGRAVTAYGGLVGGLFVASKVQDTYGLAMGVNPRE